MAQGRLTFQTYMDEQKARDILKDAIGQDGSLRHDWPYVWWEKGRGIALDDVYSLEYLEALVWWVKNNG
jgi:hypothetical protein